MGHEYQLTLLYCYLQPEVKKVWLKPTFLKGGGVVYIGQDGKKGSD